MDKYMLLGIGAAIVGYILSYVAYHYIETRNVDKDEHDREAIGNIHVRCAMIAGLSAFVAMFLINKNSNGELGVLGGNGNVVVQKMDTGQPGF